MNTSFDRQLRRIFALLLILCQAEFANAQFTTILNIPPDPNIGDHAAIGSNTQLNLGDSGSIGFSFDAGANNGSSTNVEVNVNGGTIADGFQAFAGSTINVSDGDLSGNVTSNGATFNVDGGRIGSGISNRVTANGGFFNIAGGEFRTRFSAENGAHVTITQGLFQRGIQGLSNTTVSMSGGEVKGGIFGYGEVNISGGTVNALNLGSTGTPVATVANVTGGVVSGRIDVIGSATLNFSGGRAASVGARYGGTVVLSGGKVPLFSVSDDSSFTIVGGEFAFDGVPVVTSGTVTIPEGVVVSGTLADGSFFISDPDELLSLAGSTVILSQVALPPAPPIVNVPSDPTPSGLQPGQTLNLSTGGDLGDYFGALNANLNMSGGVIGNRLFVVGTNVQIAGGTVGEGSKVLSGSTVTLSDGAIGGSMLLENSTINISGGAIGPTLEPVGTVYNYPPSLLVGAGSVANMKGGTIVGFPLTISQNNRPIALSVEENGIFRMSGGTAQDIVISDTARAEVSGGNVQGYFRLRDNATAVIVGGSIPFLQIDQAAHAEVTGGQVQSISMEEWFGSLTVGDGADIGSITHFGFSTCCGPSAPKRFIMSGGAVGRATLANTNAIITAGQIGDGLHVGGKSVIDLLGGTIGNFFVVNDGFSNEYRDLVTVNVAGGAIGNDFKAVRALVNITDGTVGHRFAVTYSRVNLLGGTIGNDLKIVSGGSVLIDGGTVGDRLTITSNGGSARIVNGTVGQGLTVNSHGVVTVVGGTVGPDMTINSNGRAVIGGGVIGEGLSALAGSTVDLFGTAFELRHLTTDELIQDLTPILQDDAFLAILQRDVALTGTYNNGQTFRFELRSTPGLGDYFNPSALLRVKLGTVPVPEPTAAVLLLGGMGAVAFKRRRRVCYGQEKARKGLSWCN